MTDLTPNQHAVLKILIADTTAHSPLTGFAIAKRIGLKERRSGIEGAGMRSIINTLRVKGFPVCANGRGYFYAHTDAELSTFVNRLQNRIMTQEAALKGLKESFHNVGEPGKVEIEASTEIFLRTPRGTVTKCRVEVDRAGAPIIPTGYERV